MDPWPIRQIIPLLEMLKVTLGDPLNKEMPVGGRDPLASVLLGEPVLYILARIQYVCCGNDPFGKIPTSRV